VRVRASSVNPVDAYIAGGVLNGMVEHEFPVVLGRDYAGVVEQAGSAVTGYAVGDEVFGFLPHGSPGIHDGTWAELILVSEDRSVPGGPHRRTRPRPGRPPWPRSPPWPPTTPSTSARARPC
jgi:NADPH:quinone reductase-like Zn-dependent oxidoreductase